MVNLATWRITSIKPFLVTISFLGTVVQSSNKILSVDWIEISSTELMETYPIQAILFDPIPPFRGYFETIHRNLILLPGQKVHLEPGRSIVAQCGSLISRVLYVKEGGSRNFLILDAGMNDLIRPALYGSYHKIENLTSEGKNERYDVVGPVCESSDCWGKGRILPHSSRGDFIAIRSAGAYGQVMAMRYNARPLAKEYYSDQL